MQPLLRHLLVNSAPVALEGRLLTIGLEPRHADRLRISAPGCRPRRWNGICRAATRRTCASALNCWPRARPRSRRRGCAAPAPAEKPARAPVAASAEDLRAWRDHPSVRQVLEAFNAKIIRVDIDAGAAEPQPDGDEP
ncbi:MAG: hypothetical protein U1F87_08115 [Kiritimatiellia bacterium]